MNSALNAALEAFHPTLPLGVAFSGGADSTALLLGCARRWPKQVWALHVNHGLQAAAPVFEAHCRGVCARLGIPLRVAQVHAANGAGQSPEDAARIARYQALAGLAQAHPDGPMLAQVALAQHADDQVETVLLALSRGAGLPGLSAMPQQFARHGVSFCRPLLAVPSQDLRAWLAEEGLSFIDDPTNADTAFTRNRIRADLLPPLEAAFPHFRQAFARSASHAAQAQSLLDELAQQDVHSLMQGSDANAAGLPLRPLQELSPARQSNALRFWLKHTHGTLPSTAQLAQLLHQIAACKTRGHRIHIKVGAGFVQRQGALLTWYNP